MQTKSTAPLAYLPESGIPPLIAAYYEFNQLKLLYRQGWLKRGIPQEKCESVAEHTLGVAVLAMWLTDQYFPQLDRLKVVRMALLHDFGEIYAGDITPADGIGLEQKQQLEAAAVEKIFSKLSEGQNYIACWQEYEAGKSPEARFVRQVDRLEMAFQASIYQQQGLSTPGEFIESARRTIVDAELAALLSQIEALLSDS